MKTVHHHFPLIYSTNTWALQNSPTFARDALTIVTADEQSLGRGRLGREWKSPAGKNIYMTFGFFLDSSRRDIGNIPQVLALTGIELLRQFDFVTLLKWPNDLMIDQKKVGGILTETKPDNDTIFIAVGIGINVNMSFEETSAIDKPATSLLVEGGHEIPISSLQTLLIERFEESLALFIEEGFSPFLDPLRAALDTRHPVQYSDGNAVWHGQIAALNDDGSLTLRLDDGSLKVCHSGELIQEI
ncbi:MAG: biotin--[acetyl-CoA-carboxylase] ligase [Chlamydiales bacterium]|nr:biotin--[acetyl-CoA-carboxylase] ligase [Chlamydiia bacterium]MCP5507796.1 biotin--[acetyl-CoA-carboxylase] ligase [Chlamydiales bacterium]